MDDSQETRLSREDMIFNRLRAFHRQRVESLLGGSPPLYKPESGFMVVHLIPEESLIGRSRFSGAELNRHGGDIPAGGSRYGQSRLNADGLYSFDRSSPARAFSQLFRDGRLEAVMSDIAYQQGGVSILRVAECEHATFGLVGEYLKFCKKVGANPPVWLFATLVNCQGVRIAQDPRWGSLGEDEIDRSPAGLPEMKIASLDVDAVELLRPLCDAIWQAGGFERSFNYDKDGKWHEPQ